MFNAENGHATDDDFVEKMRGCCGSEAWCRAMLALRPISDPTQLKFNADVAFEQLTSSDWLEAFACHPKIGDVDSLRMKFVGNDKWSQSEQSGVSTADENLIEKLARGNGAYEAKFGYIFIVCATGKSADEMSHLLEDRIGNDHDLELKVAAVQQRRITQLRIDKLVAKLNSSSDQQMTSHITTHVLDTGHGKPAAGVEVLLYRDAEQPIGQGETDADGRVMSGLISDEDYQPGIYRLCFRTGEYFKRMGQESFYPEVVITFEVAEGQAQYHVPLLLARFGYSTYRGS